MKANKAKHQKLKHQTLSPTRIKKKIYKYINMEKSETYLVSDRPILPECEPRRCDGCGAGAVFGTELSCGHMLCCRVYYVDNIYDQKIRNSNVCGMHSTGDHQFVYYDCPKRTNETASSDKGSGCLDVCSALLLTATPAVR